jgi:hypothetical protein
VAKREEGRPLPRGGLQAPDTTPIAMPIVQGDRDAERRAALERIKARDDHRRVCAGLDQLAPLALYYRRRRDRWAA